MHRTGRKFAIARQRHPAIPIEPLERRYLLASAVAALDDLKNGPLARVGALVPLLDEYQSYVSSHGSPGGFVPADRSNLFNGDGVLIEAYNAPGTTPAALADQLKTRLLRNI